MLNESMERIRAFISWARVRAKSLFPEAVDPIMASCFMAVLYHGRGSLVNLGRKGKEKLR